MNSSRHTIKLHKFLSKYYKMKVYSKHNHNLPRCEIIDSCQRMMNTQTKHVATLKQSIIPDLSQDIDIQSLKLKRKELLLRGERKNIHKLMEEELEERCFKFLLTLNPHEKRQLKIVQLEHSHAEAEGYSVVPFESMTNKSWIEALTCSTADERLTYFLFMGYKYKKKKEDRNMELIRKREWEHSGRKEGERVDGIIYADEERTAIGRLGNYRLASAMRFGPPLLIDMDFDGTMTSKEIGETAKQLWMSYSANKRHQNPFHLIFTGCGRMNSVFRTLELRHLLDCDHFLATTTEKSYLDLYEKPDIVYLTPHAKQTVKEFDHNSIYVLAAYSDMLSRKKMAIAKATQQKIKCQRLPIDENIKWVQGNKDLFLNVAIKVLLDAKDNKSWTDAFVNALATKHFRLLS